MQPNPVLRKLGLADTDRVVIIHTDDIGMCQSSVSAFNDLWQAGVISSGAVMVPCPWALEAAALARDQPEMDLGVHLTITSEWPTYRWGPISTRDRSTGLMDGSGFFHAGTAAVQKNADPVAVGIELQAQIEWAAQHGMDPSHIDTHMGAVAHLKFIPAYAQMALQYHLPAMIFRMDVAGWQTVGLDLETARTAAELTEMLEEQGLPLLDQMVALPLNRPAERRAQACRTLSQLRPGITHFIIHPSKDTPELRAITPDWPSRVADYHTFCDETLTDFLRDQGIHVIGYRSLRDLM